MYQSKLYLLVAVLVATPVGAEICISHGKYGLAGFRPECAVLSAFKKAFDASGRPRPKITEAPSSIALKAEGQRTIVSITFNYEIALFDNAHFRQLGQGHEEFSTAANRFTEELTNEICQAKPWLELHKLDNPFYFLVKFRLNAVPDVNETFGFPREVHVSIDNCEAR